MTFRRPVRNLALVAHVGASVGWLGAVLVSLALGILALTSSDPLLTRSVYVALEPVGWWALVPFSLASLGTGVLQALGTRWGLLQHYWVLFKLIINVLAAAVLLLYMQTLGYLSQLARSADDPAALERLRTASPVLHAAAAAALLLIALGLSIIKPRGLTPRAARGSPDPTATPSR